MTAAKHPTAGVLSPDAVPASADAAEIRLDGACRAVVEGRRAGRALTRWASRFRLSEPEFQLLWRLRHTCGEGFDQRTIAGDLALSPALVSATVEKLRVRGWIAHSFATGDRRRHLWQLTDDGRSLLVRMRLGANQLEIESAATFKDAALCASPRKDAA